MTMNDQIQGLGGSHDAHLDRLVDGELSQPEYQTLLASLEQEPGGWRRCALAFLEAQAIEHELGGIRRSLDRLSPEAAMLHTAETTSAIWEKARLFLAVAASFVVVFGLGLIAPRLVAPKFLALGRQEGLVSGNINTQSPTSVAENATDGDIPQDLLRYVGDLRLLVDGSADGATESGSVPVYEVGQDVNQYLSGELPALGPELIELFRQRGYDVRHEQQYFPAALDDGRQLIVPVDGYQITPVSRRY